MKGGVKLMTVGNNLHKTLTGLESAKSSLEEYALETEDTMAQDMYNKCAQQINSVVQDLNSRTNYVESQEPQYKARQTNQKQQ